MDWISKYSKYGGTFMQKKSNHNVILEGNLAKGILALSIPIVINSLIQTMYNLTDTYWLGQIGTNPMAAITLVSPIQAIIVNFGQGLTVAGSILIAQYVGAKDERNAKDMTNQLFLCTMIFSLFCSLVCFLATPSIIGWLGADGNIFTLGKTYLQIVILDMPFLFLINIFTAVNQSQGNTVKPMLLNLLGIVLNMILDPLFLIVFKWGVAGAALATLLAKVPCALIAVMLLINKQHSIHLDLHNLRFDLHKVKTIIRIGLPTAIGGSTMQFGFLLMSRSVLKYGSIAVAAYGIGNRVNGLITMPANAMGSATATIVGQNIGAKQLNRAEQSYKLALKMSVAFLFIGGLILSREFIATSIVGIFSTDSKVIVLGTDFLCILALYCWTNGIYNTTIGLFQGSGHTMVTMLVDASRLWVFRFLTLFVCENLLHMGVRSIWYSVVISNGLSAFILLILYFSKTWKKDKLQISNTQEPSALAH